VAQAVAFLSREPAVAALLPPGLAEENERLLRAAGLLTPRQVRRIESPRYRRLYYRLDSLGAPGQLLFVGLRKRLVDDEARQAIAAGCRQLLVLGGGLDLLALRLARAHPEVTCVEVDHPASQRRKRAALSHWDAQRGELPANLHLVPADLGTGELAAALTGAADWDASAATFVVAEAVFMYLDPAAVEGTLRALHGCCGAGSALLFSYLRRDARGRLLIGKRPWLAALALAAGGEPLRWSVADGELGSLLARTGWRLETEHVDLRARYLAAAGLTDRQLADIEIYARASRE
jgi:methyltransferase (TIGR00027 family)